jgi:hypothetical protein
MLNGKRKGNRKRKEKTASFVAEFPVHCASGHLDQLLKRLEALRQLYNACIGHGLKAVDRIRKDPEFKKCKTGAAFKTLNEKYELTQRDFEILAEACRDRSGICELVGSHDTQTSSFRAFKAVMRYAVKQGGRPRFKGFRGLRSVEGKQNAVLVFDSQRQEVRYLGLKFQLILDKKDKDGWESYALASPVKYTRIIVRKLHGKKRVFVQLVLRGESLIKQKHQEKRKKGIIGMDLGPSNVSVVSVSDAEKYPFCPSVQKPWKQIRRLQRRQDLSRRQSNPNNFNLDGTISKGKKIWKFSKTYQNRRTVITEIDRKLSSERKRSHGELCNRVLEQGTIIRAEKLNLKGWQKNWGKSVGVHAPGMFQTMLERKSLRAGGRVEWINPWKTKLSQFDHVAQTYKKKPLSQRWHQLGEESGPILDRDIYSAFLAMNVSDGVTVDVCKCREAFAVVEPQLVAASTKINRQEISKSYESSRRKRDRACRSKGNCTHPRSLPREEDLIAAQESHAL